MFVLSDVLEEFYVFAVIMDPVQNTLFSALYLKNSLFDWKLKFKEMTEWFKIVGFSEKFS